MASRSWLMGFLMLGALSATTAAGAQESTAEATESVSEEAEAADEAGADGEKATAEEAEDAGDADAKEKLVADAEKGSSPVEEPGKSYKFIGARYRLIVVPKFIIGLFADGGTTVGVHAFGPEFAVRKDNFEFNFSAWYAAYSMSPTPFKATSDGNDAWELVESRIKVLYLTADFLWSHDFSPQVALNYGMGAGFGLVWGPLYRNQAYPVQEGNFDNLARCVGQGNPSGRYCGGDNNHYNNYEEPSWSDGGSKPFIFPWLALQTGIRYKAHRNFVARFDTGFGLSGFFFGVGADYGL
ncbi:MAG TPA: hypothetical protein VER33_14735 [Polyangiaceae bacterium]|nr:hypothetical protein [Polyangiaceae bacterium]